MPNALYKKLIATMAPYIGEDTAFGALDRQLTRCRATADTVSVDQLRGVLEYLTASATLYLHPDKGKQAELAGKIEAAL